MIKLFEIVGIKSVLVGEEDDIVSLDSISDSNLNALLSNK